MTVLGFNDVDWLKIVSPEGVESWTCVARDLPKVHILRACPCSCHVVFVFSFQLREMLARASRWGARVVFVRPDDGQGNTSPGVGFCLHVTSPSRISVFIGRWTKSSGRGTSHLRLCTGPCRAGQKRNSGQTSGGEGRMPRTSRWKVCRNWRQLPSTTLRPGLGEARCCW